VSAPDEQHLLVHFSNGLVLAIERGSQALTASVDSSSWSTGRNPEQEFSECLRPVSELQRAKRDSKAFAEKVRKTEKAMKIEFRRVPLLVISRSRQLDAERLLLSSRAIMMGTRSE